MTTSHPRVILRDYQAETAEKIADALAAGGSKRLAVQWPTGSGKTILFAELARRWHAEGRTADGPIMVAAHRHELVQQAAAKIRYYAPEMDVGIVQAIRHEIGAPCLATSVPSMTAARRERTPRPSLLVIDECHHSSAPTYRALVEWAQAPVVGVTATLSRADGVALGRRGGGIFDEIIDERSILWMIRHGHLVDVAGHRIVVSDLDLRGLRVRGGDFSDAQLSERLLDSAAPKVVAAAVREHVPDDPGILFAPTVESARVFAGALRDEGFSCEALWGSMPFDKDQRNPDGTIQKSRSRIIKEYDNGKIQWLTNCMILTEGFDSPRATVAVIARPTQSTSLFTQMVGRVLRPDPGNPGKRRAFVVDVVGASAATTLCDLASLVGRPPETTPVVRSLLELYGQPCAVCGSLRAECRWDDPDDPIPCCAGCTHRTETGTGLGTSQAAPEGIALVETDLFAGSRQQWLRTMAGFRFLSAGERFIVLIPRERRGVKVHDVIWVQAKGPGWGGIVKSVPDLGLAMAAGESDITSEEEILARKAGQWRTRPPRRAQLDLARSMRIALPSDRRITKGELSDLISIRVASARLDRTLLRITGRDEGGRRQ